MSAREVTPPTRNLMNDPAYSTCIANLRAAGYLILSPDELRGIRDKALEFADLTGKGSRLSDGEVRRLGGDVEVSELYDWFAKDE